MVPGSTQAARMKAVRRQVQGAPMEQEKRRVGRV
jgi:hypothetical protein